MPEILLVDDERALREGLKAVLTGEGYRVRTACDGKSCLARIAEHRPDLVLLDVMMPKANGFFACEEIRKADSQLPVIFLTAKDSEADQVRGIGLGADDYVSKTAGEAVLLARIRRAIMRQEAAVPSAGETDLVIRIGEASVNISSLTVSFGGREAARLTRTECDILRILDAERGRYFRLDEIIAGLRGKGYACEDAMVYMHISNLRRKLGRAGRLICCMRSVGYCIAAPSP